ncbi:SDR family NAD(P)-dependent oxidoreductase [Tenuifilum thalassicum]|uniref:SDR family NAD(P)-dependent oxidoreductase n=1 Tax=Tenuifilum thalassicum TaxID=2590900 RepID=A0A7D3XDR9_9BACT|nr:SDR family NAD(P)-dependent oxidoreductase [Tenuifilum thalassicum]QKG79327.1 SDR family NAD(P)-dependent oxidoreductase [Tenuifilum thalassicum]
MTKAEYRKRVWKYVKQYEWSNVFAMIRNNRKSPEICDNDFTGKNVVITGATSGIGYYVARKYASKGANLICINRNKEKSENLKLEIESEYHVRVDYFIADLSSIEQIHAAADFLVNIDRPIDVIIHNAGIFLTKKELTPEGFDKVFIVHYLSSFIINYKLINKLKSQGKARIILVNSEGHRFAAWGLRLDDLNWEKRRYSGLKSYGSAKLAQLLSMLKFAEEFNDCGVTINAMHPGAVKSESGKDNGKFYRWYKRNILDKRLKPASISAEAIYFLGVSHKVENISGKFFNLTTLEDPTPPALDYDVARELWNISLLMSKMV